MRRPAIGQIGDQEAKFLELLLDQASPDAKEVGLERLCKRYRSGYRLKNPHPVRQRLTALLHNPSPKVVRWALNAVAAIGTRADNLLPTLETIERYRGNDDVLGAGVAALIALTSSEDVIDLLSKANVPLEGTALLAAAQQTDAFLDRLSKQRVKPERAPPAELRLATILVGLDKAPKNLFEPKYENAEIIGVLNAHDDKLVAQYSIWAITENPSLSIKHLKIPLSETDGKPENIRSWIYQLAASDTNFAQENLDYLTEKSRDGSGKARLGLATGLRRTYFGGLDGIAIDWLSDEEDDVVKFAILDHMAIHSEKCGAYKDAVRSAYANASKDSLLRIRLEATTSGLPIYTELRRISYIGESLPLFDNINGGTFHMTQNITATNIGIVSGRDTNVSGDMNNTQHVATATEALDKLIGLLQQERDAKAKDGISLAQAAKENPIKSRVQSLLDWMKTVREGVSLAAATSPVFVDVAQALQHLMQHLPH